MTDSLTGKLDRLLADPRFEQLKQLGLLINPFHIVPTNELSHSAMLAWLLDPAQAHGLGDKFLRRLLMETYTAQKEVLDNKSAEATKRTRPKNPDYSLDGFEMNLIQMVSLDQAIVCTELDIKSGNVEVDEPTSEVEAQSRIARGNIDIVVIDPQLEYVIAIENKYGSGPSGNQLKKYQNWVEGTFSNYHQIFLVIDAFELKSNACSLPWIGLNYDWIVEFLETALATEQLASRTSQIIGDYLSLVRDDEYDDWNNYDYKMTVALHHDHKSIFQDRNVSKLIKDSVEGEYDWESLNEWSEKGYSVEKFIIYRYLAVFEALLSVESLAPYAVQLEMRDPGCLVETKTGRINYFPSGWLELLDEDAVWPLFLQIKLKNDVPHGISLVLNFHDFKDTESITTLLREIAEAYGIRGQKSGRKLQVSLEEKGNDKSIHEVAAMTVEVGKHINRDVMKALGILPGSLSSNTQELQKLV